MYIPKQFEIKELAVAYEVIQENSFATLFSQHNGDAICYSFTVNFE